MFSSLLASAMILFLSVAVVGAMVTTTTTPTYTVTNIPALTSQLPSSAFSPRHNFSPSPLRPVRASIQATSVPQPVISESTKPQQTVRRVVLAYSGGLDTSVIVSWLKETYNCEVICFTADIGQGVEELEGLRQKALASGASDLIVRDLRLEFVRDYVWPCIRAGAQYGRYLLGTAMARPLIAKAMVELALEVGADGLAHGCTGKGNDQVRFETVFASLAPHLKVIAPWREWSITGRQDAIDYAEARGIPIPVSKASSYSRDRNLFHLSHEGDILEDAAAAPVEDMFMITTSPKEAPDSDEFVTIGFRAGLPVSVNGVELAPVELLERVNEIGARHGIGRADIVENRVVGMKSRGVYETPGGTILFEAARELDSITLDDLSQTLKDQLADQYGRLVYNGRWFHAARLAIENAMRTLTAFNNGEIRLRLFKGAVVGVGRTSPYSFYSQNIVSFDDDPNAGYDQKDATGFIRLFTLPMRISGSIQRHQVEPESENVN